MQVYWFDIETTADGVSVFRMDGTAGRRKRGFIYCTPNGGGTERAVCAEYVTTTAREREVLIVEELTAQKRRVLRSIAANMPKPPADGTS